MGKYSEIRNVEQLQAAVSALREETERRRKSIEGDCRKLRDGFSPLGAAAGLLSRGRNAISWTALALTLLRRLRGGKRRPRR